MSGFWLIFRHEYRKKVRQRSFLVTTLGVPLMIVLMMGISIFSAVGLGGSRAIGYIDESGMLAGSTAHLDNLEIDIRAYPDVSAAQAALASEELRAYYVIPADYLQTGQLDMYYQKRPPNELMQAAFDQVLRAALHSRISGDAASQLLQPPKVTVRSMDGSREISQGGVINLILPIVASFGLIFTVMMSAGSLLQIVADEKENRTIEILVTSLTPEQLMGGKTLAIMAVCLTQITIWLTAAALCLGVGALYFEPLRQFRVPSDLMSMVALFFLPAYVLIASIMTAIGGAAGDMRQGQQIAGLLNLVFMLPMIVSGIILQTPDHPLAVALTLFPATSFTTLALRWSLGTVPAWQMILSWVLLAASAAAGLVVSARIFRLGMLHYGKGLDLRAIAANLFTR